MPANSLSTVKSLVKRAHLFETGYQRKGLLVFSVFQQSASGGKWTQFIEAAHPSRFLDLLGYTITNTGDCTYPLSNIEITFFDIIRRSICYKPRVIVIGNVSSEMSNSATTSWILSFTENIMENGAFVLLLPFQCCWER